MPYILTEQIIYSKPLKLGEYLAIGCSIVSMKLPQADKFTNYINIANNNRKYVEKVAEALNIDDINNKK